MVEFIAWAAERRWYEKRAFQTRRGHRGVVRRQEHGLAANTRGRFTVVPVKYHLSDEGWTGAPDYQNGKWFKRALAKHLSRRRARRFGQQVIAQDLLDMEEERVERQRRDEWTEERLDWRKIVDWMNQYNYARQIPSARLLDQILRQEGRLPWEMFDDAGAAFSAFVDGKELLAEADWAEAVRNFSIGGGEGRGDCRGRGCQLYNSPYIQTLLSMLVL